EGIAKSCYILSNDLDFLADAGGGYILPHGTSYVTYYGSGLNGIYESGVARTAACTNLAQGGDVHPGVQKHCWGRSDLLQ
ncbi:MAG TPA: hypothetical protein VFQ35_16110, partial [Polyangiaceae bacterium]|nr:hypothetical protein [Polyangiaceae bacterium]